jgi:hypothetical protein
MKDGLLRSGRILHQYHDEPSHHSIILVKLHNFPVQPAHCVILYFKNTFVLCLSTIMTIFHGGVNLCIK